ncbi:Hypothetical protein CFV354_0952 [Campylobacter fetus subsp. venerealis NCTC 10354]|nr:Hypothetical protein CFV354_0952 [Campylobacter fetus subsp. venerealis NCTC 10354]
MMTYRYACQNKLYLKLNLYIQAINGVY